MYKHYVCVHIQDEVQAARKHMFSELSDNGLSSGELESLPIHHCNSGDILMNNLYIMLIYTASAWTVLSDDLNSFSLPTHQNSAGIMIITSLLWCKYTETALTVYNGSLSVLGLRILFDCVTPITEEVYTIIYILYDICLLDCYVLSASTDRVTENCLWSS